MGTRTSKGLAASGNTSELLLECRERLIEIDDEVRGLRSILELTRQISTQLDLDKILKNAMTATVELTGAERGYIVMKEPDEQIRVCASFRFDPEHMDGEEVAYSRSVILHTIRTGQSVLTTDATMDERFAEATSVKMQDIRAIMAAPIQDGESQPIGVIYVDDRFHSGKFNKQALRLLEGYAGQVSMAIQAAKLHDNLIKEKQRAHQLEVARAVQQRLIPREVPVIPGYEIAYVYKPAQEVGGDLFQFLEMPDGATGVLMADVSGKGVPAALVMTKIHEAAKMLAKILTDPVKLMAELNKSLCEDLSRSMMVTAMYLSISSENALVRVVRAGHCPLGVVRASKNRFEWHGPEGLVLGMRATQWLDLVRPLDLELEPEDGLLLFTDGVTEAFNENKEEYEMERVAAYANKSLHAPAQDFVHGLLQDIRKFTGGAEQNDDIAIVYLRRC